MIKSVEDSVIVVLCNGCFDIFHAGHLAHLKEARQLGDTLVVALTLDAYVNKGPSRPINLWEDRAELLRELRCVDRVIPTTSAVAAILYLRPTIFVKGVDYAGGGKFTENISETCLQVGAVLCYTRSPKQSASEIIRRATA